MLVIGVSGVSLDKVEGPARVTMWCMAPARNSLCQGAWGEAANLSGWMAD